MSNFVSLKFTVPFTDLRINFGFDVRSTRKTPVWGLTNRCSDGLFVIFIDYDDLPINDLGYLTDTLMSLQADFSLGNFYVFRSNTGYHAICIDKVALMDYVMILKNSGCDPNYVNLPYIQGKKVWTLRMSQKEGVKPVYVKTVGSRFENKRTKSTYHAFYLYDLYRIQTIKKKGNYDGVLKGLKARYYV